MLYTNGAPRGNRTWLIPTVRRCQEHAQCSAFAEILVKETTQQGSIPVALDAA
jgi:hypothetical protein